MIPIAIYLVLVVITYLLEGRINLLKGPDRIGRFIFVIIANIIIKTLVAIYLLKRSPITSSFVTIKQSGSQPIKRTLVVVAIAGIAKVEKVEREKKNSINHYRILSSHHTFCSISFCP